MTTTQPTWNQRLTGDDYTVDAYLYSGEVTGEQPTASDLAWAAEFLSTYGSDDPSDPSVQAAANVVMFLLRKEAEMNQRRAINDAKRAFAAERGIPVSQVRIKR